MWHLVVGHGHEGCMAFTGWPWLSGVGHDLVGVC